jgi:hypothetical protein
MGKVLIFLAGGLLGFLSKIVVDEMTGENAVSMGGEMEELPDDSEEDDEEVPEVE